MNRIAMRLLWIAVFCVAVSLAPARGQQTPPRTLIWESVLQGEGESELRWPIGVAGRAPGELAVIDGRGPRLVVFVERNGAWTAGRTIPLPAAPRSIAHDGDRYLVSTGSSLIAVEGARHQLRELPLPEGTRPGAVAASETGRLFVEDRAGGQILVLGTDGSVERRIRANAQPVALAAAPGGGVYAVFPVPAEIRLFVADGREAGRWPVPGSDPVPAWPVGLAVSNPGSLVVVDRHGGRLLDLDASGRVQGLGSRRGWDEGLLRFPAGIAALPDGRLAVADQGNGRVQLFRRVDESGP